MLRTGLHQEGAGQVVREDVVSYDTKMDDGDEGVGIVFLLSLIWDGLGINFGFLSACDMFLLCHIGPAMG